MTRNRFQPPRKRARHKAKEKKKINNRIRSLRQQLEYKKVQLTSSDLMAAFFAKESEIPNIQALRHEISRRLATASSVAIVALIEKYERDYKRGIRLDAYRKRHRWRRADVGRLLQIGVSHAGQRRIGRLLTSKAVGRGVVHKSISFQEMAVSVGHFWTRLFDRDTPPNERRLLYKQTRWWPDFIEAAYRGERMSVSSTEAEARVAAASGVSASEVHRLCQMVRNARGNAAPEDPPTTAEELRRHLEFGPAR
ncbi:MAG: hypothetical protein K2Y71_29640 [Xanthobacteraceae bacterium]|nr:hypothetical protein [Xanthobacteraceae bacterium]